MASYKVESLRTIAYDHLLPELAVIVRSIRTVEIKAHENHRIIDRKGRRSPVIQYSTADVLPVGQILRIIYSVRPCDIVKPALAVEPSVRHVAEIGDVCHGVPIDPLVIRVEQPFGHGVKPGVVVGEDLE